MRQITAIPLLALGFLLIIGMSFSETSAELSPNKAHLVEGSGFAVTDKSIKISQIDFLLSTGNQAGSSIRTIVEDGFVTMDEIDFIVEDISGNILRDGRFIRLVGTAENSIGSQVTISLFGKLVQNTDEGSIYSFSGKLTQGADSNKIIYTTKISTLGDTVSSSSSQTSTTNSQNNQENIIEIIIAEGSANPADFDYISQDYIQQKEFLTPDRISTIPGMTLTFINEDLVSHSISSGHRDTTSSGGSPNTLDGRFTTGEIPPGQSRSITIDDIGFYSLFDVDYPWMTMDVVVFPDVDSDIIRRSETNPIN